MKNTIHLLLGLVLALSLTNCQSKNKTAAIKYTNQRLTETNDQRPTKTIDIAEVLNKSEINLNGHGATNVTYYDADCSTCLMDLETWKTTLMPYFEAANPQVEFRFILKTGDRRILDYNLQRTGIPEEYVIIDTDDRFLNTTNFVREKVVDEKKVNTAQKIVFVGFPLVSEHPSAHYAPQING